MRSRGESALGRTIQVLDGVTPGSGPGHLALFGYDPFTIDVGRGLLEALGVGADVGAGDIAIRGNLCVSTTTATSLIAVQGGLPQSVPRRCTRASARGSGRSKTCRLKCSLGCSIASRLCFAVKGSPGKSMTPTPRRRACRCLPQTRATQRLRRRPAIADAFGALAREVLAGEEGNAVLLRGISSRPPVPTYAELARLRACAIAAYPAYKGVARLLGMHVVDTVRPGCSVADEITALETAWDQGYDYFFVHVKGTDSAGEDGDLARKAKVIEEVDRELPRVRALKPDVIVVTGDHATPAPLAAHSWHPVPTLLWGPHAEPDDELAFDEAACHRAASHRDFPRPPSCALPWPRRASSQVRSLGSVHE